VRYIDDFVVCFQFREDALRLQDALRERLGKFGLTLEPTKTKLVEFGRFAQRHASGHGRKRPETIYFLDFTLYCTRNLKGNFKVGMRTEKSRLRRSLMLLCDQMRQIRHLSIQEQVHALTSLSAGTTPIMALPEISARCRGRTGSSCVSGARCSVAAAGRAATSPEPPSIGS
jgi:hypothetical protein